MEDRLAGNSKDGELAWHVGFRTSCRLRACCSLRALVTQGRQAVLFRAPPSRENLRWKFSVHFPEVVSKMA